MTIAKIALAAALTLASGAAFAGQSANRAADVMKRGAVQQVAMERSLGAAPRTITGAPASAPTIFGHAPLTVTYGLPHLNGG